MKKKIFVVTGGEIAKQEWRILEKEKQSMIIAVDGGAKELLEVGIIPDLVVGDFDTIEEDVIKEWTQHPIMVKKLPVNKSETDTHAALKEALQFKPKEIIFIGALGKARFDHTLANIGLLEWLYEQGVSGIIHTLTNRIRLLVGPLKMQIFRENFRYLSLVPVTKRVEGIFTEGLLYPLVDESLCRGLTKAISNEWIAEKGQIQFQKGICLLIESSDEPPS